MTRKLVLAMVNHNMQRNCLFKKILVYVLITAFSLSLMTPPNAHAQAVSGLPVPGAMVYVSPSFNPITAIGITVYPEKPLFFDLIVHPGDDNLKSEEFKQESQKLVKYFLASLTVPEDEMWVNLSPYEKDRIIPDGFGQTEMGRDLLAQDYMLKQLTASLMYPEDDLGHRFWDRVYKQVKDEYGVSEIPMNTFNKVWIIPDKAMVYESGTNAFIVESRLKVMLEDDYLAMSHQSSAVRHQQAKAENRELTSIIKEIIIPEIEREVNEGKTFAKLRQIYHAMILARWYKDNLKESLLGQAYVDQNKTSGIDLDDKSVNRKIYDQYIESFKKGVYDFIKEDYDPMTQEIIPRKYFSGGVSFKGKNNITDQNGSLSGWLEVSQRVSVRGDGLGSDFAMTSEIDNGMLSNGEGDNKSEQRVALWRRWWGQLVSNSREDAAGDASVPEDEVGEKRVKMTRRAFNKMITGAAAAAGAELQGLPSVVQVAEELVSVRNDTFVDLFFANLTPERLQFFMQFYSREMRPIFIGRFIQGNLMGRAHSFDPASSLGHIWDYSESDPFFSNLPTEAQLTVLLNFFKPEDDLSKRKENFERFAQHPAIREYASSLLQRGRDAQQWDITLSQAWRDKQKWSVLLDEGNDSVLDAEIEKLFNNWSDIWLEEAHAVSSRLPSQVEAFYNGPEYFDFGELWQKFMAEGRPALEASDLFQSYLRVFWRPMKKVSEALYQASKQGQAEVKEELLERSRAIEKQWDDELARRRSGSENNQTEQAKPGTSLMLYPLNNLISQIAKGSALELRLEWRLDDQNPSAVILRNNGESIEPTFLRAEYVQELVAMIPEDQQLASGEFKRITFAENVAPSDVVDQLQKVLVEGNRSLEGSQADRGMLSNGNGNDGAGEEERVSSWRKLWRDLVTRSPVPAPADGSNPSNETRVSSVLVSRRGFNKMIAGFGATAGMELQGVPSVVEVAGAWLSVRTDTFADLFFANLTPERLEFFRTLYIQNIISHVSSYQNHVGGTFFSFVHRGPADVLAQIWEYSEGDPFFHSLPTNDQLNGLLDFFETDQKNYRRLVQHPAVRDYVLLSAKEDLLLPDDWNLLSKEKREKWLDVEIEEFLDSLRYNWLSAARRTTRQLAAGVEAMRNDPEYSDFGELWQQFLNEGRPALEQSDLFQSFLGDFWKPLQEVNSALSEAYREGRVEDLESLLERSRAIQKRWKDRLAQRKGEKKEPGQDLTLYPLNRLISQMAEGASLELRLEWRLDDQNPSAVILRNNGESIEPTFLRAEYVQELVTMIPEDRQLAPGEFKRVNFAESTAPSDVLAQLQKALIKSNTPGGIDLNPNVLDLQKKGEGVDFNFTVDPQQIQNFNIDGLKPVIINITPITNIPLLLGLDTKPPHEQISSAAHL